MNTRAAKRPEGAGGLVLYLDYDGVLHHEDVLRHPRRGVCVATPGFELFEHAALLDELLAPFPSLRIVLSTTWVRTFGCSKTADRLPPGLRQRVVGATFHSSMDRAAFVATPRGEQVVRDVGRRRPRNWFAIDDTDEGWPDDARSQLVLTDEQLGISAPGAADAICAQLERLHIEKNHPFEAKEES